MKAILNGSNNADRKHSKGQISAFRRILPQALASCAKNLLLFQLGMTMGFSTIAIAALTGNSAKTNPDEGLRLTSEQATWLGSLLYIGKPVGSCLSGWITDPLGRKLSMILVNVPLGIAWILLANSSTVHMILMSNLLLGLGAGLMEAPIITYLGEICEPSVRGALTGLAGISVTSGIFLIYWMGNVMAWRMAASISATMPLVTAIAVCFVPETPIWLLSKNRTADALRALQWLRGWVPTTLVQDEFNEIVRYNKMAKACDACKRQSVGCAHPPPTPIEKIREINRTGSRRSLILLLFLYVIAHFTGITAMRPFIVQIFLTFGVPIDAGDATVYLALTAIFANIFMMSLVRFAGKRPIYLGTLTIAAVSLCLLAHHGFTNLPQSSKEPQSLSYYPMILIFALQFCSSMGITSIPPMLISEFFPFKSRAYATAFVAAMSYIFAFVASKTFYDLEALLSLPGTISLYGTISIIGLIVAHIFLPETENRTLEDIELYFADKKRRLTDIHIPVSGKRKPCNLGA